MKIDILDDISVSRNGADVTCAYPFVARCNDGALVCVYRRGREKHSYDGVLVLQRSADDGRTWSEATTVFDGREKDPPWSPVEGAIAVTPSGALLCTLGATVVTKPDAYLFSDEGRTQQRLVLALRSEDGGATWSEPAGIDYTPFVSAGITAAPVALADGRIMAPVEVRTDAAVHSSAVCFSEDDGRTFGPLSLAADDPTGTLNLCDERCIHRADGSLLMLLWTFDKANEVTLPARVVLSRNGGATWLGPVESDLEGQIAVPLELPDGRLIAATNHRRPPEGIRLYTSLDGLRWTNTPAVQMWDARTSRMLGTPLEGMSAVAGDERVWDALPGFTFGTPDLTLLPDGTVLLTYYAIIDNVCHVRACRFGVG